MIEMTDIKRYANLTDDTSVEENMDGKFTVGSQGSDPVEITEAEAESYIDEVGAEWIYNNESE